MQKRKIDELISHFNRKVADMDIDMEYRMELLGMITAIGIACEKELNVEPGQKWETCFDCPLSNGCPKIRGCTNEQAEVYASGIPDDCPLSIEPERKTGKWIPQNLNKSDGMISTAVYYYPKCSVCGANANYTKFCPNCGAKMEGTE